jgi:hypothetical protein
LLTGNRITGSPTRTSVNCVYVSSEDDYQYQQLRLRQQLVNRQEAAAAMNENAAEQEQFNWMMWPPGPFFY